MDNMTTAFMWMMYWNIMEETKVLEVSYLSYKSLFLEFPEDYDFNPPLHCNFNIITVMSRAVDRSTIQF